MADLTPEELVAIGQRWAKLGWAVQEQLVGVLKGDDPNSKNPNALKLIIKFFEANRAYMDDYDLEQMFDLFQPE